MNRLRLLIAFSILAVLPACDTLGNKKKNERAPQGTVSIKLDAHGEHNTPIYLAAYAGNGAKEIKFHRVKDGSVTGFILPLDDTYEFRAFVDRDGSGTPGPGEPVGSVKGIKPDADVKNVQQPIVLDIPGAGGSAKKDKKEDGEAKPATDTTKAGAPKTDTPAVPLAPATPPVPPPPGAKP